MARARRLFFPIFFVIALSAAADQAAQQDTQRQSFGDEVTVRLVSVPVVARDRKGRPVKDLQPGELTVLEGKKLYPVASVTPLVERTGPRSDRPRVRLITQLGTTQHIAASSAHEPRYMAILVDVENDPPAARKRAMEALTRFLRDELDPSFQVALLLFDGNVRQLVPFTQDRHLLANALATIESNLQARARRIRPELRMELLLQTLATCRIDDIIDERCLRDSAWEYAAETLQRANAFLGGLESVVQYLAGLDGRKSVLMVGGNVSLDGAREAAEALRARYGNMEVIAEIEANLRSDEVIRPRVDALMSMAHEHGISFSFIDRTEAPSDFGARHDRPLQAGFRPLLTAHQRGQEDLAEIAAATGGTFVASTRVDEGLRRTVDAMEGIYFLNFHLYDDEPLTPARVRRMSISSSRPGVRIRHQRGFEVRRAADDAPVMLGGTIDAGAPVKQEIEGAAVDVTPIRFVFDPRSLGYVEQGDRAATQFAVHIRLRSGDGDLLADSYRVVSHSYDLQAWQGGGVDPPALLAFAELPDGDYIAEAVVTVPRLDRREMLRRQFSVGSAPLELDAPADVADEPQHSEPRPARTHPAPAPRDHGSSISFGRQFLGVVAGTVDVDLMVGRDVGSVEVLVNGERAAVLHSEPWTAAVDLGEAPSPLELMAVARDRSGREIGRARQSLNVPRPAAELDIVIIDAGAGRLTARLAFESIRDEKPVEIKATLDDMPLTVSDSAAIALPPIDLSAIHLLRVEARFETSGVVTREVVFGGQHMHQVSSELSSTAVQLRTRGDVAADDVKVTAAGSPARVVALEKGPADVIVVVDPRALRLLPGLTLVSRNATVNLARADHRVTPGEADLHLRLIWPVPQETGAAAASSISYRLFPSTAADPGTAGGGLLWHIGSATFPAPDTPVRLADAAAVAGPMALERNRRRVVLLLHGGSPSAGHYSASAVRSYLEQLRVPLVVWSTTQPAPTMLREWGAMEVVTSVDGLRRAWRDLLRHLDRQRVVWVEGTHLPQTLDVGSANAVLAGASGR